ncbi:MAG: ABC transporter substrate-binding protein [Desulfobaccales bacterium]
MTKVKIAVLASALLLAGIAGFLWQTGFLAPKAAPPPTPPQKITVSILPIFPAALLLVAQEEGYFRANGLEVVIQSCETGRICLDNLQSGRADVAFMAAFVFLDEIFKGSKSLRILGSPAAVEFVNLLALKDQGILQPGDLRGKRVGVARSTVAEFFLGRFLTFNNLSWDDVKVIPLSPSKMASALANNQVDAVMVWNPINYEIKRQLGEKIISWPGQTGQKFYEVLVSTDKYIQTNSMALEKLFRALAQAEDFIKNNPAESQEIVAEQIKVDKSVFQDDWLKSDLELSFDQSLLIAMEDEARWLIRNRLTDQAQVPDYLNYFDPGPLSQADPEAVHLIMPGQGSATLPDQPDTGRERR